jgi:hypothetical protein
MVSLLAAGFVALAICVHIVVNLEGARRDRDFCDALARLRAELQNPELSGERVRLGEGSAHERT